MKIFLLSILFFLAFGLYAQVKSTSKLQFSKMYFEDSKGIRYVNEDVIIYSIRLKKEIRRTTDSSGCIEIFLPNGLFKAYSMRFGVKMQIGTQLFREWYVVDKPNDVPYIDSELIFVYDWNEHIAINVQYETGNYRIHENSYTILDELAEYLTKHSEIKIEIAGHTDNVGASEQNLVLSQKRADSVKKYLILKGILSERLAAIGKGGSEPIYDNDSEENRAKNRRTELRII